MVDTLAHLHVLHCADHLEHCQIRIPASASLQTGDLPLFTRVLVCVWSSVQCDLRVRRVRFDLVLHCDRSRADGYDLLHCGHAVGRGAYIEESI